MTGTALIYRGFRMGLEIVSVTFLLMSSLLLIHGLSAPRPALGTTFSQLSKVQGEPGIETYPFVHHETTGITSYAVINGKEKAIQFRADSDPLAVKSLNALSWRIVLPNAHGKKLFLTGQYFAEPKHTSSCDSCPTVEEYSEFKLVSWYITTPFKIVREDCADCSYLLEENLRTRRNLEVSDFQDFDGRDKMDVRRFQRAKRIRYRHRS